MINFQCQCSIFVFLSSWLFSSLSVEIQQTYNNQSFHLNVTDCPKLFQIVSPSLKELLEIAECSKQMSQDSLVDNEPTFGDTSASDDERTVVVGDVRSLLINNTHLQDLSNQQFCNLPNLTALFLRNNQFEDGDRLGFGTNCQPQSCGLQLEVLALEGNRLRSINASSFLCNMRTLRTLYLQNNDLESIQVHAFANSSFLSHMYISNNSLVSLARGTFFNLSRLWTLDLSYNKLNHLDCFRDPDLRRLGNLDLNNNELVYLEHGVFDGLETVVYMTLANNRITTVADGAFRFMKSLDTLEMEYNNFTRLYDTSFYGLIGLLSLELRANQIDQIQFHSPDLFPNLNRLSLQNNLLGTVPILMGMDKLKELILQNNLLETVANSTFENVTHLKSLDLSFNQIKVLEDECFINLTSLTHLNLNHNRLTYTEHLVTGYSSLFSESATMTFQNLIDLDLSHNLLTEFQFYIPHQFTTYSLKYLNVSYNNIKKMNFHSQYEPILQLIVVDMSHNLIPELQTEYVYLNNLPNFLEDVYCNDNQIRYVDPEFLQRMPKLRQLNLSNNRLTSLYLYRTNRQHRERIVLGLAGNNWLCDCNLVWLRSLINNPSSYYLVEDYDKMVCTRQFHRFRDVLVPLRDSLNDTDFLCRFSSVTNQCIKSSGSECALLCPESCTCYNSSDLLTVIVDCYDKNLTTVPSVISKKATSLYLDANNITQLDVLPYLPSLVTLLINHTGLMSVNVDAFSRVKSLQNLFIQNNMLTFLPDGLFDNITDLRQLNLAYNRLATPSVHLFMPLRALDTLYLNDNHLSYFPVWNLRELSNWSSIALSHNPWSCDCYFVMQFTSWMSNSSRRLLDSDEIYCLDSSDYPIYLNNFDETICFNATSSGLSQKQTVALFSIMGVVIVVVVLLVLIFIFRYEMQVLIYSRYGLRLFHHADDEQDVGKLYDAFVSYSSLDEQFVVRELLPGLEGIPEPYKLCLHHRDFPIGAFINESIFQAIDESRRTILILSDNFVQSEWCRFEFRTAHAQMLQDRQNRVIVIIFEKIPADADMGPEMRLYLRTNTYLTWGDNLFWKKLYFVLPQKRHLQRGPFQEEGVVAEDVL